MIELIRQTESGIWAVAYRGRRPLAPVKLGDGVIVEEATAEQRRLAPGGHVANLGIDAEGRAFNNRGPHDIRPATVFLDLTGFYLLPSGDVAAVYGAQAVTIDPGGPRP